MSTASIHREAERLAVLHRYEVLDTPAEPAFDDLARLAGRVCEAPIALVTLIDGDRQWCKARLGVVEPETPRSDSLCAHAVLEPSRMLVVGDVAADPRFAQNGFLARHPEIRFYAGAPLVTPDGHALGAIGVMDVRPRGLGAEQQEALAALGRCVMAQLELRRQAAQIRQREREIDGMLAVAGRSRRALLSVLEDERRTGQHLRESEERFRQVVENISEVFWMSDVEKQRIIYASPGYEVIWGRPCAELYESIQSWVQSIHPDDRERVLLAARTRQQTGEYDETYRILRPDGVERWVRDRAFPVREADGRVRRVVGVAEDITDRRHLEERFLRAQRMEAVGALASGIAHDLNNILAPVMMAAGILRSDRRDPKETELLGLIEGSSRRGAGIIRQLLTFSRGMEGQRSLVQVRHLVKETAGIIRETFPRNIQLAELSAGDLWPVLVDPTHLHQVLMNLCVNARDAMPDGGRLSLAAANRLLDADRQPPGLQVTEDFRPGRYVEISVGDSGHGIPPAIRHRIFEPFFTTKEIGRGTGLGLSTVLGIVRDQGGFITLESEPGQGTTFRVYLPAAPAAGGETEPTAEVELPTGQGETILVVDDEEHILAAVREIFERGGYQVLVASNGAEALRLYRQGGERIRLVLTDLMMPVMDGYKLARQLRELGSKVPIVGSSGLKFEGAADEPDRILFAEILPKPYSLLALLQATRRHLAPRSTTSPLWPPSS